MDNDTKKHRNTSLLKSKLEEPSDPSQVCKVSKECGACAYINSPYSPSFQDKYQKGLQTLREAGVLNKCHVIEPGEPSKTLGYRTHAKLAVRTSGNEESPFDIGLFKPTTHDVVDISDCPLHKSSINRLVRDLKTLLADSAITPYNEENHSGDLRYLAIRASHHTDELMVTFVMTHNKLKNELRNLVKKLKEMEHQISSCYLNINEDITNVIFGPESKHVSGANRLRERICDFTFEIGPTSFFQVNPWTAEVMYRRIEQLVGYGSQNIAWDLYSGIGQISMILGRAGYRVFGVEMNPQSVRDAQRNVARNFEDNLPQFQTGRVEDVTDLFPNWAQNPKVIVTNPARKGLDEKVRSFLATTLSRTQETDLIYMSCEVESLARDLADLHSQGLQLKQLEAYDMFPHTSKLEWLAIIKK